jgi:hypothetical protein
MVECRGRLSAGVAAGVEWANFAHPTYLAHQRGIIELFYLDNCRSHEYLSTEILAAG